jgi:hypothetical protein
LYAKPTVPRNGTADRIASGGVTQGQKTGFGPRIRGIWPMHSLSAAVFSHRPFADNATKLSVVNPLFAFHG